MGTCAVCMGLLVDSEENKKQLKEGFESMGFTAPRIIHYFNTLPTPGEPDTGGRSDVIVEFADEDIGRLACHPLHLGPDRLFSWADDYLNNNRDIIPQESLEVLCNLC
jgi:hypothetical protein